MMKLDVIENVCDLNPVLRDWERLNTATPMQSPTWMMAWWQAFHCTGDQLRIVVVRNDADTVVGLAPWYAHTSPALGTTIQFLGCGRACSDYQTILCQDGYEQAVVAALAEWLSAGKRASSAVSGSPQASDGKQRFLAWDLLDFDGVSAADATMNAFIEQMAARGHITHSRDGENTWKLKIGGDWQAFLDTQSKTQRSQSRNLVNRFDKSGDLQMRLASDNPAAAEPLVAALVELHEMRWRSIGRNGCFHDPRMRRFFTSAMNNMIAEGSANIAVVQRSGRPVAAQAWLIQGTELFVYQCGRDPAEDPNRIGRIANLVGIRWATQHGYQWLDYLRGDEEYKSQLRATSIPAKRIRVVARAGVPQLRHNIWLACRQLKSRWQQLRRPDVKSAPPSAQDTAAGAPSAEEAAAS